MLTSKQAQENQKRYGMNEIREKKKLSIPRVFLEQYKDFLVIILIVSAAISGLLGDIKSSIVILVVITMNAILGTVQTIKAEQSINSLAELSAPEATVFRDGEVNKIPASEVTMEDEVILEAGDRVPADGRLLRCMDLKIDESMLTGESLPVKKDAEFVCQKSTPVAERANMLYSGCFVSAGNGQMLVTGVGNDTEFGQIAQELSSIEKTTTPLQEKLDKLGKQITVLGASAAAIVFAIEVLQFVMNGQLNLDTVSDAFITSIVLIVAAVPEGLPTIVAVSLALNIIKMSKENALVKKMIACETIGCVNIICSDKTGTLTENRMTVQKIYTGGELIDPEQLKDEMLLKNYCINSNANISEEDGSWSFIGNPTEGSLLAAAAKAGVDYQELRHAADIVRVFPFSSQNKDMSTIVRENGKEILYVKGNPEKIISLCTGISEEEKEKNFHLMEEFQNKAGRLLAFAHKELEGQYNDEEQDEVEQGLIYDGFVVISDPLSQDVYESIRNCRSAGIEVKMLTGDNIRTARAIANELHMLDDDHIAVEAADIEKLTDEELKEALKKIQVIARSTPLVKMRVVKLLKEQGNVVAVTGDGINDAPAIKHADVGIAMGIAGTDVTKEASDMVLLDDSFSTIIKAVQWGRGIYENFKRFIQFQLTVNVSSVVVVICSILAGFSAPFTALELLWINIIMDGPPALTLGLEPIRPDLLKHKPTRRNENIISKKMLLRIFVNGIFISVIFMLQHFKNFLGAAPEEEATVLFTLFVLFQLFNAFNCRELDDTPMFKNLLKNKLMLGVFLLVLILQGIITQFGAAVFETVPLSAAMWGKMLLTAFTVIILNEGIKAVKRLFVRK